ncbi:MAG: NAD-glutamate dehydrogenase [Hyphomicrobiaceae bacterium]
MTPDEHPTARKWTEGLNEVIERVMGGVDPSSRPVFGVFARLLFARLESVRSIALPNETLAAIALDTFHLLQRRSPGSACISIGKARLAPGAATSAAARVPHDFAVLTVINDDKPFLVSSVMAEIQARGLKTFLVLHPVHQAQRDGQHLLTRLVPRGQTVPREAEQDWHAESVIVVVMEPLEDAVAQDLSKALRAILDHVDAAVRDWKPMIERLDRAVAALEEQGGGEPASLVSETIAFIRWMRQGQFVFLGMREYRLDGDPETGSLRVIEGSGLGVLANPDIHVLRRGRELVSLTDEVRRFYLKPSPIIITKSNVQSVVHRRAHMDYVGLKIYSDDGRLAGELRIVGLFTAAAYTEPPSEIPFLRLKVARIFEETGIKHASHEGRMLQNILDTFPRDELIQIGVHQLASWVPTLLQLEFEPRIRAFVRRDRFDRFVSIIIFVPRDRFSTKVREKIGAMLADAYQGRAVVQQPFFTPGPLVRVHYIIGRYEGATPEVDETELERRITDISETWQDRLERCLADVPGASRRFGDAFPATYAESFPPERALEDIERIERLSYDGPVAIDFYRAADAPDAEIRAAIYRFDKPIPLSDRVPILENLGFSVIDERTYRISPRWDAGARSVCLHDMVLELAGLPEINLHDVEVALEAAFVAAFTGGADNDLFNRLVMVAGADWREAAMLRAYAAYMRQIGLPYDRVSVAETLARHPSRAADLIRFFKTRFDPAIEAEATDRSRVEADLEKSFEGHLAEVSSLDEDRILRTLWGLTSATLRTNFFLLGDNGQPPPVLAFKISSRDVADAPEPRPFREIWVSGPQVDGVHLRFAPIARGGLRWSDRAHDFRTEVLGLAKAQQVKNTVIVPQGAKGGFVPKQLPADATREDLLKAGITAYRTFISTLLSLTDNLVGGSVVPPPGIVRRDSDDPYLVVAADKGTATFSDYANAISEARGFWLGDAFASGGSAGYDHKKMGITARGAWEGVKRHFREMDHDIQSEAFTVAGVGDMSGDVFGNGMLLSRHIRLVAAFDHRDIFIDPSPDEKVSFGERERLFRLPRSSWQDYDKSLFSPGGGVFSRSAKSVQLTPEIRVLLGLDKGAATPNEIIRAILKAKVDLFWFGGIGTYVRGDREGNADVGDRGNDAIRVTAMEFGGRVVGEGANLGLTQQARIDFALRGGRINTDFIDNSAGVNSSDQEVNIKIALAPAVASGTLDMAARNALLTLMTEDVARACLANNYEQTLALSLAEHRGAEGMADDLHLVQELEKRGLLDRDLEHLPDDAAFEERRAGGIGLTRPELAVLMSFAKIALSYDLIASAVPDDPAVSGELSAYFPHELQQRYAEEIAAHPLRREIITTALTNRIINVAGLDMPSRLAEDWDLGVEGVAHALITALEVTGADSLFALIGAEDNRIGGSLQIDLYSEAQRQLRVRAAWQGAEQRAMPPLSDAVRRQIHAYRTLALALDDWLSPERHEAMDLTAQNWISAGAPAAIATALARGAALAEAGDICLVAESTAAVSGHDPRREPGARELLEAAAAYVALGDLLRLSALKERGRDVDAADRFDRLAINGALASLAASHRRMARLAMRADAGRSSGASAVAAWRDDRTNPMARAAQRLSDLVDSGPLTVARLTVAAGLVRDLAEALEGERSPSRR